MPEIEPKEVVSKILLPVDLELISPEKKETVRFVFKA